MQIVARACFAVVVLASLGGCASNEPPPVAAVAPLYLGLASGSLGEGISASDKAAANKAEVTALVSGERKTWRGDDGAYGYIAPTPGATGDCREFTHTVYINGRPKVGKGTACRAGEGWKLNG